MGYLRNTWYMVGWDDEITRALFTRVIIEESILFYRKEDGTPVAMSNCCPHRFAPLHKGRLIGDVVECPYHGLQFDCTGKCVHNPHPHGKGKIPKKASLKFYPVVERFGAVWIWMGEKQADQSLLPDFYWLEQPETFRTVRGSTPMNCYYELISDNILDLSHLSYVHAGGIGPATEDTLGAEVRVAQEGLTVISYRCTKNIHASPAFQLFSPPLKDLLCDKSNDARWEPPGHLAVLLCYRKKGVTDNSIIIFNIATMLTPASKTQTHQFWSLSRDFNKDSKALDEALRKQSEIGLEKEDREIIEAQQKNMGTWDIDSLNPVRLIIDAAPVMARRVLAKLIEEEQA